MRSKVTDPTEIQFIEDACNDFWNEMRVTIRGNLNGGPYEKECNVIHKFFRDNLGFTFDDDFNTVTSNKFYIKTVYQWSSRSFFRLKFNFNGNTFYIEPSQSNKGIDICFRMKRSRNPHLYLQGYTGFANQSRAERAITVLHKEWYRQIREYDMLTKVYNAFW